MTGSHTINDEMRISEYHAFVSTLIIPDVDQITHEVICMVASFHQVQMCIHANASTTAT